MIGARRTQYIPVARDSLVRAAVMGQRRLSPAGPLGGDNLGKCGGGGGGGGDGRWGCDDGMMGMESMDAKAPSRQHARPETPAELKGEKCLVPPAAQSRRTLVVVISTLPSTRKHVRDSPRSSHADPVFVSDRSEPALTCTEMRRERSGLWPG